MIKFLFILINIAFVNKVETFIINTLKTILNVMQKFVNNTYDWFSILLIINGIKNKMNNKMALLFTKKKNK